MVFGLENCISCTYKFLSLISYQNSSVLDKDSFTLATFTGDIASDSDMSLLALATLGGEIEMGSFLLAKVKWCLHYGGNCSKLGLFET
jgi:hypothetical protein